LITTRVRGRQRIASAQARCNTQFPRGTINPLSSAIGMNTLGRMRQQVGWRQRSSASNLVIRRHGQESRLKIQFESGLVTMVQCVAKISLQRPPEQQAVDHLPIEASPAPPSIRLCTVQVDHREDAMVREQSEPRVKVNATDRRA
jgi:hypothetical protein